jgi:RNA polymerase sigma-70 factor (ECF subfamily)
MAKINLRDYYPFYNEDIFIDVSDEIADVLLKAERQEKAAYSGGLEH